MGEPTASEVVSADEVTRVVGQRVRELRSGLRLTMAEFAKAAGISLGMLSKIEHNQTSPSLLTLTRLANAAQVPVTSFFRGLDEEHDVMIVRAGEGQEIVHQGSAVGRIYQDLGSLRGPTRVIEPMLATLTTRDDVFPLYQHGGVEFLFMVSGAMEYGYGSKTYRIAKGDTMQFHGEVAHGPTELLEVPVQFISVKVYSPTS